MRWPRHQTVSCRQCSLLLAFFEMMGIVWIARCDRREQWKSELIISYFAFVQYVAKYMYSFPLYLFLVGILYITIQSLGGSKGQNERTRTKHCSHRMRPRGRLLDWANSGKSDHDCGILLCHSKLWVRDCKCYVLQCVNKTIYGFIEDYSPI